MAAKGAPSSVSVKVRGDCGLVHASIEEWQVCGMCERLLQAKRADVVPGVQRPTVCDMPQPVEDEREATVYAAMREVVVRSHCADKRPAHRCAGAITIDRDSITLNCRRCGDSRRTLERAGTLFPRG
jgi:hypothetical protein